MERLFTVGTAGREAKLSSERITQLCDLGVIPNFRDQAGRRLILESDLREFIKQRRQAGRKPRTKIVMGKVPVATG